MSQYQKQFIKLLEQIANETHSQPWQVMEDWAKLTAISFSQVVDFQQQREDEYLRLINGKYYESRWKMKELLHDVLIPALEDNPEQDFLGEIYCEPWSNRHNGEVFTPYNVAKLNAKLVIDLSIIEQKGYITVKEPACGAGCMGIALRNVLWEAGYQSPLKCYLLGVDIKAVYAYFSYIQWTLLGLSAEVIVGNSLTGEVRDRFITIPLAQHWKIWQMRFVLRSAESESEVELEVESESESESESEFAFESKSEIKSTLNVATVPETVAKSKPIAGSQLSLFEMSSVASTKPKTKSKTKTKPEPLKGNQLNLF